MSLPDRQGDHPRINFIEQRRNKQLARSLNELQERVARNLVLFATQKPEGFAYWGGFSDQEDDLGGLQYYEEAQLGFVLDSTVNGMKEVGIGFNHNLKGSEKFYKKVGVRTSNVVSVNLYTDRETFDVVQKMYAYDWEKVFGLTLDEVKEVVGDSMSSDEIDDATFLGAVVSDQLWTYYFVDREGNYAKVIGMPEEIAEDKEDLLIEDHKLEGVVSTQVPMLARDFVLMRNLLTYLDKDIEDRFQSSKK